MLTSSKNVPRLPLREAQCTAASLAVLPSRYEMSETRQGSEFPETLEHGVSETSWLHQDPENSRTRVPPCSRLIEEKKNGHAVCLLPIGLFTTRHPRHTRETSTAGRPLSRECHWHCTLSIFRGAVGLVHQRFLLLQARRQIALLRPAVQRLRATGSPFQW